MQGFGEGVARVAGLLHVQRHVDGLHGVPPLAVHLPAREFLLQAFLLDPEQKGGKGQNCGKKDEFGQRHLRDVTWSRSEFVVVVVANSSTPDRIACI